MQYESIKYLVSSQKSAYSAKQKRLINLCHPLKWGETRNAWRKSLFTNMDGYIQCYLFLDHCLMRKFFLNYHCFFLTLETHYLIFVKFFCYRCRKTSAKVSYTIIYHQYLTNISRSFWWYIEITYFIYFSRITASLIMFKH